VPKFLTLLDQQQQVKKSSEFLCEVDLDADDKDQEATKEDSGAAHFLFSASFLFLNSMFNHFYHR
jgi:hypothetical protein